MAARSVIKLLTKSCSYTLNTACPSVPPLTSEKNFCRAHRSLSLPPNRHLTTEIQYQQRYISQSNKRFSENQQGEEEFEDDTYIRNVNVFPKATDVTDRETAREFREKVEDDVRSEDTHSIYELAETSRNAKNFYNIFRVVRGTERAKRMYMHLQPSNLKPYGSCDNLNYPGGSKKQVKIVYPVVNTTNQMNYLSKKKIDDVQFKEFSTKPKEYPGYEEYKKLAVCDKKSKEIMKMNYSTSSAEKSTKTKKLGVGLVIKRRSSTLLVKKKNFPNKRPEVEVLEKKIETEASDSQPVGFSNLTQKKNIRRVSSKELFYKPRLDSGSLRKYNTQSKSDNIDCSDYVTVKLGELQEECRKAKKCKPKKLCFGQLPKLTPPDCPCIDDLPLKEGKPLSRLKKRFDVKYHAKDCTKEVCDPLQRADAHYQIKRKSLPVILPQECPCVETKMTDFVIKRLQKRNVPEPPKVCPCEDTCCDPPPRADSGLTVEKRVLPKFKINMCPCIEEKIPAKSVPLKRLERKHIKEPEKICLEDHCEESLTRADYNMQITKKTLPMFKSECVCVEPPPMAEGKPLKRLRKIKYVEKPREECVENVCTDVDRADKGLKYQPKKLPVFIPKTCPCIEPEIPSVNVSMKRLQPKPVTRIKKECIVEKCGKRADDGLVIKPKKLPVLQPKECPCVEIEMLDCKPLKKLVPKPVKEPPKICIIEECPKDKSNRADGEIQVQQKSLPFLRPGDCPCIEPEQPLPVKPLKKLPKKEIAFERVCPEKEHCPGRSDEHLKVQIKQLPKLQVSDCPCPELPQPVDTKPLKRLKKVHIEEPEKTCIDHTICEETTRADEDDWLYWKRVEVKPAECEPNKDHKRSFSTFSKRFYSTRISEYNNDIFDLKYEIPKYASNSIQRQSYNIVIDIKPSAPLILTQKPLMQPTVDSCDYSVNANLKSSRSEPLSSVTFVIYKNNSFGNIKSLKETSSDVSSIFNKMNRSISTCSNMQRSKESPCECAGHTDPDLQPRKPLIKEREQFIETYPADADIENSSRKGRLYQRTVKKDPVDKNKTNKHAADSQHIDVCVEEIPCANNDAISNENKTLWQKVVEYFKARPNCPSPEEFKKMKLKEEAERAASKAGLCLYDPKEMLRKNEKELPKVITADSIKEECTK